MNTKKYKSDLWIVIKPADDVPGTWVSHCLTLDVMSQGSTPQDAFKYLMSAVFVAVTDDLMHGRNPAARGEKTPQEDWDEQGRIVREGARVPFAETGKPGEQGCVALNLVLDLTIHIEKPVRTSRQHRARTAEAPMPMAVVEQTPPAWMISHSHSGSAAHR